MSASVAAASEIANDAPFSFLGARFFSTTSGAATSHDDHDMPEDPCFPKWGLVAGCVILKEKGDALQCLATCDEGAHDLDTCAGGCGMINDCRATCLGDDTCKEEIYEAMKCYGCDCAHADEASTLPAPSGEFASSSADADTQPAPAGDFASASADADTQPAPADEFASSSADADTQPAPAGDFASASADVDTQPAPADQFAPPPAVKKNLRA